MWFFPLIYILIFCKGSNSNLRALTTLFFKYAASSGHIFSPSKSTIFVGSMSTQRLNSILQFTGFSKGISPLTYLGIPIFKWRVKALHMQAIADRLISKLSAWKYSMLMVQATVHDMISHSICVYSWPISFLKNIERAMRNFIWGGEFDRRKLATVAWKKVYRHKDKGGLGLISLICLNEASNLKLAWELMYSNDDWACILRDKVIISNGVIKYGISASIWQGIKAEIITIQEHSSWRLGDGASVNFWKDRNWNFPEAWKDLFPFLEARIVDIVLPLNVRKDQQLSFRASWEEFWIIKAFNVPIQPSRAPSIKEIIWRPPYLN
ncbi:hypothetical protein KIW84_064436 [Lathyrus oleraceus]|uniref:Uncharacterized protein n=1 Tax=Pisum sativum TaxID=3888 RepID=A0A9D5A657_PEA|nr:hypothetical protein KIW84_064436 [Pisum sativum]